MNNVITVNGIPFSTIKDLYDYLWTCPDLDSEFTWYKIGLAMTELKHAERDPEEHERKDVQFN
jgi:hypothetical protein